MAGIPAILWLGFFYLLDRHEPEPKQLVAGVCVLGALIAAPLADFVISIAVPRVAIEQPDLSALSLDRVLYAVLCAGLAQEMCKYAVVRYTIYMSREFDEPMDGIVYMMACGTGFAVWVNYHKFAGHSVPLSTATAQAVAGYLTDIGVKVTGPQTQDNAANQAIITAPADKAATDPLNQLFIWSFGADFPHSSQYLGRLFASTGGLNFSHYNNPTVDQLNLQAAAEPDQTKAADLYCQANKQVWADAPHLWLYTAGLVSVFRRDSVLRVWEPLRETPRRSDGDSTR